MTTTTVEYDETVTVTKKESFEVCDKCGREVDDDGAEYSLSTNSFSEIRRKTGGERVVEKNLHFCSECLNEMMEQEVGPGALRVREWLDEEGMSGETLRHCIKRTRKGVKMMVVVTIGGISASMFAGIMSSSGALILIVFAWILAYILLLVYIGPAADSAHGIVKEFEE